MKKMQCEVCGGTSIIQIDEKTYECQDCGLQYDVAEVEKLIVLPQEVVEEPAKLTVEEQEDLQPTFDVAQDLEDNFTEEVEAEQEIEEIMVETDSETSPKYMEDASIESAASEETDNSTAIEEWPQSEVVEETADVNSIVEPEIDEAENVVSEDEDKSKETEADEQEETVESSAIIPWYKNKKLIIPSIAGIALALIVVVLLIVLLPKGNVPVSDDNSSDIQSNTSSESQETTSEINSSENEDASDTTESSQTSSTNGQTSGLASKNNYAVIDGKEIIYYPSGAIECISEGNKRTSFYENGKIKSETIQSGDISKYTAYDESGRKTVYEERREGDGTEITYFRESGVIDRIESYYANGSWRELIRYNTNGLLLEEYEYDKNGNLIKSILYDENGNVITTNSQQNGTDNSNSNVNSVDLICPLEKGSFQIVENLAPGIALVVTKWTQVRAAGSGTVTYVGGDDGYGMSVIIDHGDGLETKYINLRGELNVMKGAKVSQGTPIGSVGSDDIPSGNMFFLVAKDGVHIDPREYVDFY